MYIDTNIFTYLHVYMYNIYIFTHVQIRYIHIPAITTEGPPRSPASAYIYTRKNNQIHTNIYIQIYIYAYIHVRYIHVPATTTEWLPRSPASAYIYIRQNIYRHTNIYIHTYLHIYMSDIYTYQLQQRHDRLDPQQMLTCITQKSTSTHTYTYIHINIHKYMIYTHTSNNIGRAASIPSPCCGEGVYSPASSRKNSRRDWMAFIFSKKASFVSMYCIK